MIGVSAPLFSQDVPFLHPDENTFTSVKALRQESSWEQAAPDLGQPDETLASASKIFGEILHS